MSKWKRIASNLGLLIIGGLLVALILPLGLSFANADPFGLTTGIPSIDTGISSLDPPIEDSAVSSPALALPATDAEIAASISFNALGTDAKKKKVREEKKNYANKHAGKNGVVGAATSLDGNSIVVFVEDAYSATKVPGSYSGISTQIIITGRVYASPPYITDPRYIEPENSIMLPDGTIVGISDYPPSAIDYSSNPNYTAYSVSSMSPLVGGISISANLSSYAGTLGLITYDSPQQILTNAHVIALYPGTVDFLPIGQSVVHPGTLDGGTSENNTVGYLYDYIPITFNDMEADNYADAATASLNVTGTSGTQYDSGGNYTVSGTIGVLQGDSVRKSGRTTDVTETDVLYTDADVQVWYTFEDYAFFQDQIIVENDDYGFGSPGDSGSCVDLDGKFVGLFFAGSPLTAVICKAEYILDALGVSAGTPEEGPPGARHWVGNGGDWSDNATHWSTTSGGSPGAYVPGSSNDVYFDSSSFNTSGQTVSIDEGAYANSITWTGVTDSPTISGTSSLSVSGGVIFDASVTKTFSGTLRLAANSGNHILTSAGSWVSNIFFIGSGNYTLGDNLETSKDVGFYYGDLATDGNSITCDELDIRGSQSRYLDISHSDVTVSDLNMGWWLTSNWITGTKYYHEVSNLVLETSGSTLNITGGDATIGGGFVFGSVEITGSGIAYIYGANTFGNLTRTGTASTVDSLLFDSSLQTITGNLTLEGNSGVNRLWVRSEKIDETADISANSVSCSNVDFMGIVGEGSADWDLSGIDGGSGDAGNNNDIIFTSSQNHYWVATNGGDWSISSSWSTSTGGASGARVPLPQDNCYIDANSLSGNDKTITSNTTRLGHDIDFTGTIYDVTWQLEGSWGDGLGGTARPPVDICTKMFGSLTITNLVTTIRSPVGQGTMECYASESEYFNTNDTTVGWTRTVFWGAGTHYFSSNVTFLRYMKINDDSTVDLNGYNLQTANVEAFRGGKVYFRDGTVTLLTCGNNGFFNTYADGIVDAGTSHVRMLMQNTITSPPWYQVWGYITFYDVTISGLLDGTVNFADASVFNVLTVDRSANPKMLKFASDDAFVFTDFICDVAGTNRLTINNPDPYTDGPAFLIKAGGGTVLLDHADIYWNVASPGTTWFAGPDSIVGVGATGWVSSVPTEPTNILATNGIYSDKVGVTWTKSANASNYRVKRNGVDVSGLLDNVASYDDTGASSPVITAGTAAASDGLSTVYVILELTGQSAVVGSTEVYVVVAVNPLGSSSDNATVDTGYRGIGTFTYQWWRSEGDADSFYQSLADVDEAWDYDTTAPTNGDGRYYKCAVGMLGVSSQYSTSDRGYRTYSAPLPTPGAPTSFGTSATETQITLSWSKGTEADQTIIWVSTDDYPTSPISGPGLKIYEGTGESYIHSTDLDAGVIYKYSAWSKAEGTYSSSAAYAPGKLGTPGISYPGGFDIDTCKVFRDYDEAGDLLIVMSYKALFVEMPAEDIKECMRIRVMDDDTLLAGGVPTQWGYRPAAIYQAPGHSFTWGAEYEVVLEGRGDAWADPDNPPQTIYGLGGSSWVGSTASDTTQLENWILDTGERIEFYYSTTDYPVNLVTYVQGKGRVLTAQGGTWFVQAIPNLQEKLPDIFSSGIGEIEGGDGTEPPVYDPDMNTPWGEGTVSDLEELGDHMNLSGNDVGAILWLLLVLGVAMGLGAVSDPITGLIASLGVAIMGIPLGFFAAPVIATLVILIIIVAVFKSVGQGA